MQIKVRAFGPLTEIIRISEVTLSGTADTDSFIRELTQQFPALGEKKFMIAIDQKTVSGNTILSPGSTVALLPPFSGG
jgi:molybdopterin synthase catalytic subunit/molybdopterin synthase sulfur carrier subunit